MAYAFEDTSTCSDSQWTSSGCVRCTSDYCCRCDSPPATCNTAYLTPSSSGGAIATYQLDSCTRDATQFPWSTLTMSINTGTGIITGSIPSSVATGIVECTASGFASGDNVGASTTITFKIADSTCARKAFICRAVPVQPLTPAPASAPSPPPVHRAKRCLYYPCHILRRWSYDIHGPVERS